jgi:hypothetical protein
MHWSCKRICENWFTTDSTTHTPMNNVQLKMKLVADHFDLDECSSRGLWEASFGFHSLS